MERTKMYLHFDLMFSQKHVIFAIDVCRLYFRRVISIYLLVTQAQSVIF